MAILDIDPPALSGNRRRRQRWHIVLALSLLAIVAALAAVAAGPLPIAPLDVLAWAIGFDNHPALGEVERHILAEIKLPRVVVALLAGSGLALSGCLMQSLFRNPLADPGLIGVSSGAALAAAITIVLAPMLPFWFHALGPFALPVVSFCGGLAATFAILRLADFAGGTATAVLLHDLTEALSFADHGLLLRDGCAVAQDPIRDVLTPAAIAAAFDVEAAVLGGGRGAPPMSTCWVRNPPAEGFGNRSVGDASRRPHIVSPIAKIGRQPHDEEARTGRHRSLRPLHP